MNIESLRKAFAAPKTEAATNTGTVMTMPASLTKEAAVEQANTMPMEQVLHSIAVILAKEMGSQLMARAMRPADYDGVRDIPDTLIERLIEELAKKPDLFFKIFRENLKIQG